MYRIASISVACLLLLSGAGLLVTEAEAASAPTVKFGMEASSVDEQTAAGVKPDYGSFWVGAWTLKHGWSGPDGQMSSMASDGVTPAIHLYYWGDDISKSCIEYGCYSSLHGAQKDKAGWDRLTNELVAHLNSQMQGKEVVIFLETEFNKADVQTYEPLDGYLAAKAQQIKQGYPNAKVVLSLGNWNSPAWSTWDRAAAASDYTGLQSMRGSTRDSFSSYQNAYESTLSGVKTLNAKFGKPVFIQDVALSSYPEPEYLEHQAKELKDFFSGLPALKEEGVEAMIYRSWRDSPNMDLANYYGQAERHWGVAWSDHTLKPAGRVWVDGVKAERSGSTPPPPPSTYSAAFTVSDSVNEWWVDVKVDAQPAPSKVHVQVNGGSWVALGKTDWGTWAKSVHAPKGSDVVFRATDAYGNQATSGKHVWMTSGPDAPSSPTPSATKSYEPTFKLSSSINEWWADVAVNGGSTSKVELRVNGGSWIGMSKTDWGTWAKSTHIKKGSSVEFRATDATGARALSGTYTWMVSDQPSASPSGSPTTSPSTSPTSPPSEAPPAYDPTFKLSSSINEWWADVAVNGGSTSKVELRVNGGSWIGMSKTDWGTWAKSTHIKKGSSVEFRATDSTGARALSGTYTWMVSDQPGTSSSSSPTPTPTKESYTATFKPSDKVNEWWVDVSVTASSTPAKVQVRSDGGSWVTLDKTSWGTWAKSTHIKKGSSVEFRATASDGRTVTSEPITWMAGTSTFNAKFSPKSQDNRYWVETTVSANEPIAKVEARVNGGSWVTLDKTSWGTYAKGMKAAGSVEFRATSTDGDRATSAKYPWG